MDLRRIAFVPVTLTWFDPWNKPATAFKGMSRSHNSGLSATPPTISSPVTVRVWIASARFGQGGSR